jgi:hypothetical protein
MSGRHPGLLRPAQPTALGNRVVPQQVVHALGVARAAVPALPSLHATVSALSRNPGLTKSPIPNILLPMPTATRSTVVASRRTPPPRAPLDLLSLRLDVPCPNPPRPPPSPSRSVLPTTTSTTWPVPWPRLSPKSASTASSSTASAPTPSPQPSLPTALPPRAHPPRHRSRLRAARSSWPWAAPRTPPNWPRSRTGCATCSCRSTGGRSARPAPGAPSGPSTPKRSPGCTPCGGAGGPVDVAPRPPRPHPGTPAGPRRAVRRMHHQPRPANPPPARHPSSGSRS